MPEEPATDSTPPAHGDGASAISGPWRARTVKARGEGLRASCSVWHQGKHARMSTGLQDYRITPAERIVSRGDDSLERIVRAYYPWATSDGFFLHSMFGSGKWQEQGWKLHVSATAANAVTVLSATLPFLRASGVRLKVTDSLEHLLQLNAGEHGATQVGKFITVYPSDDAQAVELAARLHHLTAEFSGPQVPSDQPLSSRSVVHYRYGAFRDPTSMRSANLMMVDEHGRLTPDHRKPYYVPPPQEVVDPFLAAGVARRTARTTGLFADRFLILQALRRSVWGRVYVVIDVDAVPPRPAILKEYWHDVAMDVYGRDSFHHACLEASVLASDDSGVLPVPYDDFQLDGNTYLLLERFEGETLAEKYQLVGARLRQLPDAGELAHLGSSIAESAESLHKRGLIHRDLKPDNILLTPGGQIRIIDVALSY